MPSAIFSLRSSLICSRVTDRRGFNLLHLACCVRCADLGIAESHSAKMVNLLLHSGLDVESTLPPEQDRCTALFFAVARGRNTTLIKLLFKRGAKAQNAPGGGLFAAAWHDDVSHLNLLVKAVEKVDVVVGVTPFLAAWMWKKFSAARFLARSAAPTSILWIQSRAGRHCFTASRRNSIRRSWHGWSTMARRASATSGGSTRSYEGGFFSAF